MKLKTIEVDGTVYAEVADGKPVYIHDDGREAPFDASRTVAKISELNKEARSHREQREAVEARLKAFDGIEDAESARKAMATLASLDAKELIAAGEVDKIKQQTIEEIEGKYAPLVQERDRLLTDLYDEKIGGSFARSKFIHDKVAVPSDFMQARFGRHFEVKEGRVVAKDHAGNPIYSPTRPGELADFDEALGVLVSSYPSKDAILRGANQSGGGARPNAGGAPSAGKTITRAEFEKLSPVEKHARMADKVQVVDAA